jgi:hypothetical protein
MEDTLVLQNNVVPDGLVIHSGVQFPPTAFLIHARRFGPS